MELDDSHKRGMWAIKAKNGGSFPTHSKEFVALAAAKAPKFYPADDVPKPLCNKRLIKKAELRANITPENVVILLAGHFKGKQVVFLKQLDSGLLFLIGPHPQILISAHVMLARSLMLTLKEKKQKRKRERRSRQSLCRLRRRGGWGDSLPSCPIISLHVASFF
ncbi:hypothetical protein L7F22_051246 [Adiantum nelumboides]|nr:hypothetical protein [Adiantum nelumboides]